MDAKALREASRTSVGTAHDASRLPSEVIACEREVDAQLHLALERRERVEKNLTEVTRDAAKVIALMKDQESDKKMEQLVEGEGWKRLRELDAAMARAKAARERTAQLEKAETCAAEVQASMAEEDFETAAKGIAEFVDTYKWLRKKKHQQHEQQHELEGDNSVFSLFDERSKGDEEGAASKGALQVLRDESLVVREAALRLRDLVLGQFDAAAMAKDHEKVQRFARVFATLGLGEKGLKAFTQYLIHLVEERADQVHDDLLGAIEEQSLAASSPTKGQPKLLFGNAVSCIFRDSLEAMGGANAALVRDSYGELGWVSMAMAVNEAAEKHTVRVARKFIELRAAPNMRTARSEDPFGQQQGNSRNDAASQHQHKSLERVIDELALLCVRMEEYGAMLRHALAESTKAVGGSGHDASNDADESLCDRFARSLSSGSLHCMLRELNAYYASLEELYMESTVAMAVAMNASVGGSVTSSVVDDVFYILKKSGRRAVATGNAQCLCAVLSNINNVLCNQYMQELNRFSQSAASAAAAAAKLGEDGASGTSGGGRAASGPMATVYDLLLHLPDASQSGDYEASEVAAQSLNNYDVSSEYVQKLRDELEKCSREVFGGNQPAEAQLSSSAASPSTSDHHQEKRVQSCLHDLAKTARAFGDLAEKRVEALASRMIQATKLRDDVGQGGSFDRLSYELSESEYASYEAEDPWVSSMLSTMESHLQWVQDLLTSHNYEALVHALLGLVAKKMEDVVLSKKFNQLGGLLLDRDVRNIVNYTSSFTQRTVRDKFARLTQVATLLNLESPGEVLDYWGENSASMMWRLAPSEVKRVLKLRQDFMEEDVDELHLG